MQSLTSTDLELVRGGDLDKVAYKVVDYVSSAFGGMDCGSKAMIAGTLASMAMGPALKNKKPWQVFTVQPGVGAGTWVGTNEVCKANQRGKGLGGG